MTTEKTVTHLLKLQLESQEVITRLSGLLQDAANDARIARTESQVLSLIVAALLAHVANEASGQQTLDLVLGDAEQAVKDMEAEFGGSDAYGAVIRQIREDAQSRLPKNA